jgi:hypothetical protein
MVTKIFSRRLRESRRFEASPQARRSLQLRKQAGGHPATLLTTLAVGALAGMMFAPAGGHAFVALDPAVNVMDGARTTSKTSRLPRAMSIAPARTRPEAVAAPSACTPSSTGSPARRGPVAYV